MEVPPDGVLIYPHSLHVDESNITGESKIMSCFPFYKLCYIRYRLRLNRLRPKSVRIRNLLQSELLDKDIHQYDVSITPDGTSRDVDRDVMEKLVKLYIKSHL